MPAFTIGVDTCTAAGDGGTLSGDLPVETGLAQHICQSLIDDEFDVAFSARLHVDHGIAQALQYLAPAGIPIVPVIVNVFAPPLPRLRRCHAFGQAVRTAIAALPWSATRGRHRVGRSLTSATVARLAQSDGRRRRLSR